jgi:hypothetical protein
VVFSNTGTAALNITSATRVDGVLMDEFHLHKLQNSCPFDAGQAAPKTSFSSLLKNPFRGHFDGSKGIPDWRFHWPFVKNESLGASGKMAGAPFSTGC